MDIENGCMGGGEEEGDEKEGGNGEAFEEAHFEEDALCSGGDGGLCGNG